ncbi:hypothetical protein B0H19DRAFT_1103514 [Mycena capillaripes]|nr:hypothetical protein B0H19DRAFT_1103514 [Mycena capillaripes]
MHQATRPGSINALSLSVGQRATARRKGRDGEGGNGETPGRMIYADREFGRRYACRGTR